MPQASAEPRKEINPILSVSWTFIGVKETRLVLNQFFPRNKGMRYQSLFLQIFFQPYLLSLHLLGFQWHKYWIFPNVTVPQVSEVLLICFPHLCSLLFWSGLFFDVSLLHGFYFCHLCYLVHSLCFKKKLYFFLVVSFPFDCSLKPLFLNWDLVFFNLL